VSHHRASTVPIAACGSLLLCIAGGALPSPAGLSEKTPTGLAYERVGSGPAVVLIPGSNLDRRMWNREVEWLKPRFTVIRYDLRAHGESDLPVPTMSPVDDLISLLDATGVRRANLVGLSAGSTIALDAALQAPDRIDRIVVAAPTISGYRPSELPPFLPALTAALRSHDYDRANQVLLDSPLLAVPPEARPLVETMVRQNSRLWTVPPDRMKPPSRTAIDHLEDIRAPLLVLVGERDIAASREQGDLLAKRVGNARLVVVPGGGHLLNLTSPDAFQAETSRFLQ
jgi:3-oxoadipate enol-lactonase